MLHEPGRSPLARSVFLLCLPSLLSSALLFNISPVYGSLGTYNYSRYLHIDWLAAAYPVVCFLLGVSGLTVPVGFLLLLVSSIPLYLRYVLFPQSFTLGPIYGPLLAHSTTFLASYVVSCLNFLHFGSDWLPLNPPMRPKSGNAQTNSSTVGRHAKAKVLSLLALFTISQYTVTKVSDVFASKLLGAFAYMETYVLHRSDMLHALTGIYLLAFCNVICKRVLLSVICIWIFSIVIHGDFPLRNHHDLVNDRLETYGYSILATRDSLTGYISVLENTRDHFRVLRNDHSLLGGTWLPDPKRGLHTSESVYPVFNMLEAVRLMECNTCNVSTTAPRSSALVIGLGVGTAPSALARHGVKTKVIELDPAVIRFAKEYFDLHPEVINVNEDAVAYVTRAHGDGHEAGSERYDYIIHDVFTGGAEPPELFTAEFLEKLSSLLKPSGSITINYAGNLRHPPTTATLVTIMTTFHRCRVFRDLDPQEAKSSDFVNIVAFCRKDNQEWSFRRPVEADFLQSEARRRSIPPRFEIIRADLDKIIKDSEILASNNVKDMNSYQLESALDHWRIMRTVLPAAVWENY